MGLGFTGIHGGGFAMAWEVTGEVSMREVVVDGYSCDGRGWPDHLRGWPARRLIWIGGGSTMVVRRWQ